MSFSASLQMSVGISDKNPLLAMILGLNNNKECGVCEKKVVKCLWFNPLSRNSHSICYEKIIDPQENLMHQIWLTFRYDYARNLAYNKAIDAVRKELRGASIETFLETNGAEALQKIFDTVGMAALRPSARL